MIRPSRRFIQTFALIAFVVLTMSMYLALDVSTGSLPTLILAAMVVLMLVIVVRG